MAIAQTQFCLACEKRLIRAALQESYDVVRVEMDQAVKAISEVCFAEIDDDIDEKLRRLATLSQQQEQGKFLGS